MKKSERNKEICELRKSDSKKWTYKALGKKYKLTTERIHQIVKNIDRPKKYCEKHNRYYYKKCIVCVMFQKYNSKFNQIDKDLLNEIHRLSMMGRTDEEVIQKTIMVKKLRDQFGLTFSAIGSLLKKDHSSIISIYKKQI